VWCIHKLTFCYALVIYCEKHSIIVHCFCELLRHVMVVWIFLAAVMSVIEHLVTVIVEDSVSTLASCRGSCTHYCFFLILIPLLALFHPTNPLPLPFLSWQHWLHVFVRFIVEAHFTCITISVFQCSVYRHFQNLKLLICMKTFQIIIF